jgi:uncharacterized protein
MAHPHFRIDLRRLNEEGVDLEGSEPKEFFALTAKDSIKAVGEFFYELHAERDDDDLIVTGSVEARFSVECGRCLKPLEIDVILDPYVTELEIGEGVEMIDLTEALREDILLALPSYPRCEDGNVEARECSEQGRFETTASPTADESGDPADTQDKHVWDVLDQLKNR